MQLQIGAETPGTLGDINQNLFLKFIMVKKEIIIEFCRTNAGLSIHSDINNIDYFLWSHKELDELNKSYEINDFIPGFFGIGSDGGNELLAVKLNTGEIYSIPFVPMNENEAILLFKQISEI